MFDYIPEQELPMIPWYDASLETYFAGTYSQGLFWPSLTMEERQQIANTVQARWSVLPFNEETWEKIRETDSTGFRGRPGEPLVGAFLHHCRVLADAQGNPQAMAGLVAIGDTHEDVLAGIPLHAASIIARFLQKQYSDTTKNKTGAVSLRFGGKAAGTASFSPPAPAIGHPGLPGPPGEPGPVGPVGPPGTGGGVTQRDVDNTVNHAIENSVQLWARTAPGNEDAEGRQIYAGADTYAPDAVGGQLFMAGRNGSTSWEFIRGLFKGIINVQGQTDIPAYLRQQVTGEIDGDRVITYNTTTVSIYQYVGEPTSNFNLVVSWARMATSTPGTPGRSDADLERFIETVVAAWAVQGSGEGIPGSKTFDGLFKAETETNIPAANVTIQAMAGDNSKPNELIEGTTPASTTFQITKTQAEASGAQIRVEWDLVRSRLDGKAPQDIELLLRDSTTDVVKGKHNVKDEGEGHATFDVSGTAAATYRWAVKIATKGRYEGALRISSTTYQTGDALADPHIRSVVHPIVNEESDERQAQDAEIRSEIERVEGLTAIVDALPEPDNVRNSAIIWTGDAQTTADLYKVPDNGFIQVEIPAIGITSILPVSNLMQIDSQGGTHARELFRGTQGATTAIVTVSHHVTNVGGFVRDTGFYIGVRRSGGSFQQFADKRFFLIVRYWRPARASDGHTVSDLARIQTEVDALKKQATTFAPVVKLTKAAYDALTSKDASTLYVIVG